MLERSPTNPYERILVSLAFLAPQLQASIINGSQPASWRLEQLMTRDLPFAWIDQQQAFD